MTPPSDEARPALSRREFLKSFVPINIEALTKITVAQTDPVIPADLVAPADPIAPQRFALDALKDLPEFALRQMVPVLRADLAVTIKDAALEFRSAGGEEGLVSLRLEACAAVRLFDGLRSLEQIGSTLEIEQIALPGGGFLLAREAFLALSMHGVYHPAGPPIGS
jgi:hypothetical protein